MAETTSGPAGSIFDLGYRPYEGERLGRRYALTALYVYSLRAVFGLGRSLMSKVFAIGLAVIAMVPALVQLAIAAIAPADADLIGREEYVGYIAFIFIVLALFCAFVTPEIIGRDQRNHTLPLYFSRALARADYVSAKVASLATALIAVVLLPELLLLLGSAVRADDLLQDLGDNIALVPPIIASSLVVGVFMGTVSLAIASQTPRRAIASGAVLAYFVIFSTIGSILVHTTTGDFRSYSVLVSPINVLEGNVRWLFGAAAMPDSDLALADLAGGVYLVAAVAYSLVALAVIYRKFIRLAV